MTLVTLGTVALFGSCLLSSTGNQKDYETNSLSQVHDSADQNDTFQAPYYMNASTYLGLFETDTMTNIDYIASGYNIYKGDPSANAVDPGFSNS